MIYLRRVVDGVAEIVICEKEARVPALEARDYRIVTRAQCLLAWRQRDWAAIIVMWRAAKDKPQERAVGENNVSLETLGETHGNVTR